jgi:hypothetical protein
MLLRLLACTALIGQLQWVPGAALCERHHQMASSHCGQHAQPAGPAVGAPQAPMATACALAGPCSTPAPALPADGSTVIATVPLATADAGMFAAPPSFTATPLPPPPQS